MDIKYRVVKQNNTNNVYDSTNNIVYSDPNDEKAIQYALDHLTPGRNSNEYIMAVGNFITDETIQMPSFITFELQGSITLANNLNKWLITEKPGGATNIEMIGGTYDGNKDNQDPKAMSNHVIRFTSINNSHFKDLIIQNAVNDDFTLDINCNNNLCENLIGRGAGTGKSTTNDGNGLDDKGSHNTWKNCVAEDNFSDCWVIKCNNSIFIGCVGRGSMATVGFGYFVDADHPTANGNRFENCQAYNNVHSGMALNIPSKAQGVNGKIQNNFIQGEFYNNGTSGIRFTNSTTDGQLSDIQLDIYCHNNSDTGLLIQPSNVKNITGDIVSLDNKPSDIDIKNGSNCSLDVYVPSGKTSIIIK